MDLLVIIAILGVLAIGNLYCMRRIDPMLFMIGLGCCLAVLAILVDIDSGFAATLSSWPRAVITFVGAAGGIFASAVGWFFMLSIGAIRIESGLMDRPSPVHNQWTPPPNFEIPRREYRPPAVREPPKNLRPDAELDDRYLDELTKGKSHGDFGNRLKEHLK